MTVRAVLCSLLIVIFTALSLLACATGPSALVDYDHENNFSDYQSVAWLSSSPMKVSEVVSAPRPTLEASIMSAIRSRLESKGYEFVGDATAADLLVSFTVGSREKIGREAYPSMSAAPSGRGGWATAYYGGGTGASYTQGVLAIDVFDAAEKRPVWHGVYGKRITEEDRDDMNDVIVEVVAAILESFPPE